MVFNMNKPIIKGTKKHSAILAKAEETARTHGGDPVLGPAAAAYGESMSSPDVVDYHIKSREIEFEKNEKEEKTEKETTTTTNTTNNIIERKIKVANDDSEAADARLRSEREALEEHVRTTPGDILDIKHKPYKYPDTEVDLETLMEKEQDDPDDIPKKKDTPGQYYEPGTLQQGSDPSLPPPKNLVKPTVVSKEDVDLGRVIMTEDGYREADWYTKQKEQVIKTTQKRKKKEVKPTTTTTTPTTTKPTARRNVALEGKYKNSSTWEQEQMRRRRPNYPWPKLK